jgi:hypothetical protein
MVSTDFHATFLGSNSPAKMSFFKDLTKNFEQLSATLGGGDKKKEKVLETQQQPSYGELTRYRRLRPPT